MKITKKAALLLLSTLLMGCAGGTTSSSISGSGGESDSSSTVTSSEDPVSSSEVTKYAINIGETDGASVTTDKETAAAGELVTITITNIPEGKEVDSVTTDVEGIDVLALGNNTYSFTMGSTAITINVTLKDVVADTYPLTIDNETLAEVVTIIDGSTYSEVAPVDGVYNLEPSNSYMLRLLTTDEPNPIVVELNGEELANQEGYYMFVMPAQASTLTISYIQAYTLNITYDAAAISEIIIMDSTMSSMLDADAIPEGSEIYVSWGVNPGYAVTSATLDGEPLEVEAYGVNMIMPNHNATLAIATEGVTPSGHLVSRTEGDGVQIEIGQEVDEATHSVIPLEQVNWYTERFAEGTHFYFQVTIMPVYANMYEIDTVTVNGETVALDEYGIGEFTVGTSDVNVAATSKLIQYTLAFDAEDTGATVIFTNEEGETITTAGRNEIVTATFTHPDGATLEEVLVNGGKPGTYPDPVLEGNTYTFTMPGENVVLTASWLTTDRPYSITYNITPSDLDVTLEFMEGSTWGDYIYGEAMPGTEVFVRVPKLDGYDISSATMNGTAMTIEDDTWASSRYYSFVMPVGDAVLDIVYTESAPITTYTISFDTTDAPDDVTYSIYDSSYRLLVSDEAYESAVAGETYYIDIWSRSTAYTAVYGNGEVLSLAPNGIYYELTLGEGNCEITVDWESSGHSLTYQAGENDPSDLSVRFMVDWMYVTTASAGDTVTLNINTYENVTIAHVYMNGTTEIPYDSFNGTYSFEMPDQDVVITIEWETPTTHTLNYTTNPSSMQDTIWVDFYEDVYSYNPIFEASEGAYLYVHIDNYDGYEIESVTYDGQELPTATLAGITYYTFTVGSADVEIVINLVEASPEHALAYELGENAPSDAEVMFMGTPEGWPTLETAAEGDTVYVYIYSAEKTPTAVYANGVPCTDEGYGLYSFTMPAEDVTVTFDWPADPAAEGYTITYTPSENEPDGASVKFYSDYMTKTEISTQKADEIVYVEVSPENNVSSAGITVNDAEGSPVYVAQVEGYYYFVMPASNVTVTINWVTLA